MTMGNSKWLNLVYMAVFIGLGAWAVAIRDWLGVGIDFGAVGVLGFLTWWRFIRKGPASVSVTVTLDKDPVPKGEFFTYDKVESETPLKPTAPPEYSVAKYRDYQSYRSTDAYKTWMEQHKVEYPDCSLCPLPIDEL